MYGIETSTMEIMIFRKIIDSLARLDVCVRQLLLFVFFVSLLNKFLPQYFHSSLLTVF